MALFILQPDSAGNCCECNGRTEPCETCEEAPCQCALVFPTALLGSAEYYANFEDAQQGIEDRVTDCVMWGCAGLIDQLNSPPLDSSSISINSTTISIYASTPIVGDIHAVLSVSVRAGEILVATTVRTNGSPEILTVGCILYDCSGTTIIDSAGVNSEGPVSNLSVSLSMNAPEDGEYILRLLGRRSALFGGIGVNANFDIFPTVSAGAFVVNPAIALYNDSGTTRELEACPKNEMTRLASPPGEFTNESDAAAGLSSNQVAGCLAYCYQLGQDGVQHTQVVSSSASLSSQLALNFGLSFVNAGADGSFAVSINMTVGQTLFVDYNMNTNGQSQQAWAGRVTILGPSSSYDEFLPDWDNPPVPISGTLPSFTATTTGKHFIILEAASASFPANPSDPWTVTAQYTLRLGSGSISVNPVQALYPVGLDCFARLDCAP